MTTHIVTQHNKLIAGPMKYWEAVEYVKKNHLIKRLPSKGKFVLVNDTKITRLNEVNLQ